MDVQFGHCLSQWMTFNGSLERYVVDEPVLREAMVSGNLAHTWTNVQGVSMQILAVDDLNRLFDVRVELPVDTAFATLDCRAVASMRAVSSPEKVSHWVIWDTKPCDVDTATKRIEEKLTERLPSRTPNEFLLDAAAGAVGGVAAEYSIEAIKAVGEVAKQLIVGSAEILKNHLSCMLRVYSHVPLSGTWQTNVGAVVFREHHGSWRCVIVMAEGVLIIRVRATSHEFTNRYDGVWVKIVNDNAAESGIATLSLARGMMCGTLYNCEPLCDLWGLPAVHSQEGEHADSTGVDVGS